MSFDPYEILNSLREGKQGPAFQTTSQSTTKKTSNQPTQPFHSVLGRVGKVPEGVRAKIVNGNELVELEQTAHFQGSKQAPNIPTSSKDKETGLIIHNAGDEKVYKIQNADFKTNDKQLIEDLLKKICGLEQKVSSLEMQLAHANEKIKVISIEKHDMEEQLVELKARSHVLTPNNCVNNVEINRHEHCHQSVESFKENGIGDHDYFSFNHSHFSNEINHSNTSPHKKDPFLGKENKKNFDKSKKDSRMTEEYCELITNIASKKIGQLRILNILPIFEHYPTLAKPIVHLKLSLTDLRD